MSKTVVEFEKEVDIEDDEQDFLDLEAVDILGVTYKVIWEEEVSDPHIEGPLSGVCDMEHKVIRMCSELSDYQKKITLKHEIIHGFLYECGLGSNAMDTTEGWAMNEEMVDFFAIQWDKIHSIYKSIGLVA